MDSTVMGRKIKEIREKNGLTMVEFGKYFGVGRVTVSRWEKGKKSPDLNTLINMSEMFSKPLDYFVNDEFPSEALLESLGYNEGFKKGYQRAIEDVKVNINKVFFNL